MTALRRWDIRLPIVKPLSLNDRTHWRKRAAQVAQLRADTCLLVKAANVPAQQRVAVGLTYWPRDRRIRDWDNLVPTLKATADAVVDAGVVPDDRPELMVKHMPQIAAPDGDARIVLHIYEMEVAA